jgi:hypothetical protein
MPSFLYSVFVRPVNGLHVPAPVWMQEDQPYAGRDVHKGRTCARIVDNMGKTRKSNAAKKPKAKTPTRKGKEEATPAASASASGSASSSLSDSLSGTVPSPTHAHDAKVARLCAAVATVAEALFDELPRNARTLPGGAGDDPTLRLYTARLADLLFGSCPAKMRELIAVTDTAASLRLAPGNHGPDSIDDEQGCNVEIKTTEPTNAQQHTNVLFNAVRTGGVKDKYSLSLSLTQKHSAYPQLDYVLIRVILDAEDVQEYRLNVSFLSWFFTTGDLDKRKNYNLGCDRCATCGLYHRLTRFADASADYVLHHGWATDATAQKHYAALVAPCPAQC